ncbi:MAG: hypothetical protein RIG68_06250 [Imperialibacter sp.]|uniref:hypothetical protein n=1 Tax=Imperialibacter sp. TaxID=2038411 RepID=UPI0032EC1422
MKTILATLFLVSFAISAFAQGGLAFFSSGREIAVSTNFERKIWGEFRLSTKPYYTLFEDARVAEYKGIPQLIGNANIMRNDQVALSLGLGLGYSPWEGGEGGFGFVTIPLGIRTAPFKNASNFYLLGEFSPKIVPNGEWFYVIPAVSWGMRYLFLKE